MFERELEVAIEAVNSVRELILEIYNSSDLGVEIKEDNSPVTKADKAADKKIREVLSTAFPLYSLLTEESADDKSRLKNDYVWIVDPIDGTKDFVAKNNEFTVNIGLSYKHKAVLGVILVPVTGEIYYAVEGKGSYYLKDKNAKPERIHCNTKTKDVTTLVSNFHSNQTEMDMIKKHSDIIKHQRKLGATLKGCVIAKGEAEMSYRFSSNTKEWDTCAMQILVEEAGGHLLKFDGEPIRYNREDVYNKDGYIICNVKENFLL
jgi:3'(2'), 5'-bisphosphate nucleotidase